MDPTATGKMLCEALEDLRKNPDDTQARDHAVRLLDILARWLRIGGFPPEKSSSHLKPLATLIEEGITHEAAQTALVPCGTGSIVPSVHSAQLESLP